MLHDEKKRPDIDSVMAHARHLIIKELVPAAPCTEE
jgi:hypothetical protein